MTKKFFVVSLVLFMAVVISGAILLFEAPKAEAAPEGGGNSESCTMICVWNARGTGQLCWADCPDIK
ncbi:MAG: hypothetical protein AAB738_02615 [Patescibacteria group bacterium]